MARKSSPTLGVKPPSILLYDGSVGKYTVRPMDAWAHGPTMGRPGTPTLAVQQPPVVTLHTSASSLDRWIGKDKTRRFDSIFEWILNFLFGTTFESFVFSSSFLGQWAVDHTNFDDIETNYWPRTIHSFVKTPNHRCRNSFWASGWLHIISYPPCKSWVLQQIVFSSHLHPKLLEENLLFFI